MKKRNKKVISGFRNFLLFLLFLSITFTAASQDLGILEKGENDVQNPMSYPMQTLHLS